MNFDKVVFVIALFSVVGLMAFFIPPFAEKIEKMVNEKYSTKNVLKFFTALLSAGIVCGVAIGYSLTYSLDKTIQSPTKYVGAEIVARGTDGAYIFQEMEYGTGETYRYISTNWLPYDAVYLLTVDKETDEVLVVWKTADDGLRIEAVG